MNVARDFEDDAREFGADSIKAALTAARWPWPEPAPLSGPVSQTFALAATPFAWRDPTTIARREFLYGFELRRRQASAVVGVGAGGKTTFKVGRAICMATGRDLFGHRVWNGPHKVWLVNLEDEREEIEKTVHAFMKLWSLTPADLGDRLFIDGIDSGHMGRLKVAVEGERGGFRIQRPVVDALVDELLVREIDYLDIDPFVSSHSIDENNNGAIDAVSKEWVQVAHRANCAVSLAHHVRKPSGGEASAFDARGAVSMINAVRSVLVLQKMSKEVAQELCVPECDRKRYLSVYDDKNNKAPSAGSAEWYEFVGVGLGNGDHTGPEDNIGALQRWQPPNAFAGVTARQLLNVQNLVQARPEEARKHPKAQGWVGKLVAHVTGKNLDDPSERRTIEKMIGTWLATGVLRSVERADDRREVREYVEVGTWAVVE